MPEPGMVTDAIAQTLRERRLAQGWSLEAFATRSGISKGMLVQIEQGRTNPSISTLCRLADGLGITLARLVEVVEEPSVTVVRAADVAALFVTDAGSEARLLVGTDPPRPLELWDWRLEPGDGYDGEAHDGDTVELIAVLEGRLTLTVEDEAHELGPGDAASYVADRAHRYANEGLAPVRFVMAVGMPNPPVPPPGTATPPSHSR